MRTWKTCGSKAMVVAALIGLLAVPAALRAQISVSPIDFSLDPGGQRIGAFTVTNETATAQQVTVYANDWDRTESGNNRFYPLGTLSSSCKGRLQIFPQSLRLEPKSTQQVRVALDPADSSRAACWTIAFAETAPASVRQGSKLAFVTRIGVKIYVTSSAGGLDATIDSMSIGGAIDADGHPLADSTKHDVIVVLHNTGGQPLTASGSVEFRTLDNKVVARVVIDDTPVLPGALRRIRATIPALPSGNYIGLAVLGYGGSDDVAGQISVVVP